MTPQAERGLMMTDTVGNILLIDRGMHATTRLAHSHNHVTTWAQELDSQTTGAGLPAWIAGILDGNRTDQALRIVMKDGNTLRLTTRTMQSHMVSGRLNAYSDTQGTVRVWELEPFWLADRNLVPRWIGSMPTGAWVVDLVSQQLVYANSYVRQLYGQPDRFWEDGRPYPGKWQQMLHPEDRPRLVGLAQRFLRSDRDEGGIRYRIRTAAGEVRHVRERYLKVRGASGRAEELMGTVHDITHEALMVEQMQTLLRTQSELNRLRSNMMNVIAHEFRTPMMVIQSSAERSLRQLDLMGRLLSDVTRIAQTDEPGLAPQHQTVDLLALIREILQDHPDISGRQVKVDAPKSAVMMMADANALRLILTNLIRNACAYSPDSEPPVVHVAVDAVGRRVTVTVTDSGIGIPEADQAFIFDHFRRGSNATGTKGLGVGLSITKELVTMLRGQVRLVSTRVGQTVFAVELPLSVE